MTPLLSLKKAARELAFARSKSARLQEAVTAAKAESSRKQVAYLLLEVPNKGVKVLTSYDSVVAHFAPFIFTPSDVFTLRLFHVEASSVRDWRQAYHHFAKIVHPDKNKDPDKARARAMWDFLETTYNNGKLPCNQLMGMFLPKYNKDAADNALMVKFPPSPPTLHATIAYTHVPCTPTPL